MSEFEQFMDMLNRMGGDPAGWTDDDLREEYERLQSQKASKPAGESRTPEVDETGLA